MQRTRSFVVVVVALLLRRGVFFVFLRNNKTNTIQTEHFVKHFAEPHIRCVFFQPPLHPSGAYFVTVLFSVGGAFER